MVLDLVLIGLAITLEPIPLVAFLIVVASRRGVVKGAAFLFGWLLSLAIVIALTLTVTQNRPPKPNTAPTLALLAVEIAIGAGLVGIAVRQRRRMGRPKPPKKVPKWQQRVDDMSPWFAAVIAVLLQPWGLVAAGVAEIADAKISSAGSVLALVVFCLLSCSSILGIEIYGILRPERCQAAIARLRVWIDTHTDQVIVIVSALLGFWLIGKSIYTLVT